MDRHGPVFDPDSGDPPAGQTLPEVRTYLARRFPALTDAPLVASEVCQWEKRADEGVADECFRLATKDRVPMRSVY